MIPLLQSELFKIRKRVQSWVLPTILVAITIAIYGIVYLAALVQSEQNQAELQSNLTLQNVESFGLSFIASIGLILLILFGASLIGSEYSWGTLRPLLARSRSRSALLGAKWLALGIYTVLFLLVSLLATVVSSLIASTLGNQPLGWSASLLVDWLVATARLFLAIIPYVAIAMAVSMLARSVAAGIAVSIGVYFIEPLFFLVLGAMGPVFETIERVGLSLHSSRLLPGGAEFDAPSTQDLWVSAGVCVLYTALAIVVSSIVFLRRDVASS